MHPSPGERFYMEQQQRDRQAHAANEAAYANAVALASAANAMAASRMATSEEAMEYTEETFDLGAGVGRTSHWTYLNLPGTFGTALSLFVTVTAKGLFADMDSVSLPTYYVTNGKVSVDWVLGTAVVPDSWATLDPITGSGRRNVPDGGHSNLRVHGPFGSRVAVGVVVVIGAHHQANAPGDERFAANGSWDSITCTVGALRTS